MSIELVWVDRAVARIYHVSEERMGRTELKRSGESSGEPDAFFQKIAARLSDTLSDATTLVILGPGESGSPPWRFEEHLRKNDPRLAQKIIATETLLHPSDGTIAALATKYLRKAGQ